MSLSKIEKDIEILLREMQKEKNELSKKINDILTLYPDYESSQEMQALISGEEWADNFIQETHSYLNNIYGQ